MYVGPYVHVRASRNVTALRQQRHIIANDPNPVIILIFPNCYAVRSVLNIRAELRVGPADGCTA
jgi:hypothetical protein